MEWRSGTCRHGSACGVSRVRAIKIQLDFQLLAPGGRPRRIEVLRYTAYGHMSFGHQCPCGRYEFVKIVKPLTVDGEPGSPGFTPRTYFQPDKSGLLSAVRLLWFFTK